MLYVYLEIEEFFVNVQFTIPFIGCRRWLHSANESLQE